MSLPQMEQVRGDLNIADRIVRMCWSNFKATEPTYVLRDLIVVEMQKAREAERARGASVCRDLAETWAKTDAEQDALERAAAEIENGTT